MKNSPKEGSQAEGSPEAELRCSPASPDYPAKHKFLNKWSSDSDTEKQENWELGCVCHGHHGFVWTIDSKKGGEKSKKERAGNGDGSPKWPVPPFDRVIA